MRTKVATLYGVGRLSVDVLRFGIRDTNNMLEELERADRIELKESTDRLFHLYFVSGKPGVYRSESLIIGNVDLQTAAAIVYGVKAAIGQEVWAKRAKAMR